MAGTECQSLSLAAGLREVVPQALELVKGSLICKNCERAQHMPQAYREDAALGMHTTGKRCTEATAVCKLTFGIDHSAHEAFN